MYKQTFIINLFKKYLIELTKRTLTVWLLDRYLETSCKVTRGLFMSSEYSALRFDNLLDILPEFRLEYRRPEDNLFAENLLVLRLTIECSSFSKQ